MGTWKALHPQWILHAPGTISVHDRVSPGDPRTRALGPELSAYPTWSLRAHYLIGALRMKIFLIKKE